MSALDEWGDGCPCTGPRGLNHGIVPKDTCTCATCDPEQIGASRYPIAEEPLRWRLVGPETYEANVGPFHVEVAAIQGGWRTVVSVEGRSLRSEHRATLAEAKREGTDFVNARVIDREAEALEVEP